MEEIRKRLSHIVRGSKSKLKDDDVISFTFIADSGSISYDVDEVPDLMQVLKDLFEPDSLKLEVYKNSQLIRSYQLIEKPKPLLNQNPQTPNPQLNYFPGMMQGQPIQTATATPIDMDKFMNSIERLVSNVTQSQEKIVKDVIGEIKTTFGNLQSITERQKTDLEKFYQSIIEEQRKYGKEQVEEERKFSSFKAELEKQFGEMKLEQVKSHYEGMIELEKSRQNLTKDNSSSTINSLKDYAGLVKDGLTGALEVIEEHGDKIEKVVNLYQSAKATTVNPMDIPAAG